MLDLNRLHYENGIYTFSKIKFFSGDKIKEEFIIKSFEFAYLMAKNNLHRPVRSGGTDTRSEIGIFWDTFRGKLSECIVHDFYKKKGYIVSDIDFNFYERGQWDELDIKVNESIVSIKSTKHFGQLLLLEEKDWDINGRYIPAKDISYDYFLLVRIKIENIKESRKGYLPSREYLLNQILRASIEGEITGVLKHDTFVNQIIKYNYRINKGDQLKKITMDASNYYVQAADLDSPDILY